MEKISKIENLNHFYERIKNFYYEKINNQLKNNKDEKELKNINFQFNFIENIILEEKQLLLKQELKNYKGKINNVKKMTRRIRKKIGK